MSAGARGQRAIAWWLAAACGLALGGCASTPEKSAAKDADPAGVQGPDAAIAKQLEADAAEVDRLRKENGLPPTTRRISAGEASQVFGATQSASGPSKKGAVVSGGAAPEANIGESLSVDGASRGRSGQGAKSPGDAPAGALEPVATPDQHIAQLSAELASRLSERADREEDPLRTLLALGSLELAQPGSSQENSAALARLSPQEAEAARAWRDLARQVSEGLSPGASAEDSAETALRALDAASTRIAAHETVTIARAALCTRVDGFGRYAEFPGSSILAGRKQRAIVYLELDRFSHKAMVGQDGESGFGVELTQDLSLYHEADGLLAWRRPEQDITDFSRNKRRDFFVVQMIDLPETLSIGRYVLKARIRDKGTGAETEARIPLDVVAQGALLGK